MNRLGVGCPHPGLTKRLKADPTEGTDQKPQPVAVCTRCGALSYWPEMINGQRSQVTAEKRSTGVRGSAANNSDCEACPECLATGTRNERPCGRCHGAGQPYPLIRRLVAT